MRKRPWVIGGTAAAGIVGAGVWVACACTLGPPSGGGSFPCTPTSFDANNPAASGYVKVFESNFQTSGLSEIDVNDTRAAGFKWYVKAMFSNGNEPASVFTTDANGLIINPVNNNGPGDAMATIVNGSGNFWRGNVWSNGAFFETSLSLDGPTVANCFTAFGGSPCGWPAFWTMALEHDLSSRATDAQWPGQAASYEHFIEDDFFEFDTVGSNNNQGWGSGMWDWSGNPALFTCTGYSVNGAPSGYCGLLNNGSPQAPNNYSLCKNSGCTGTTWNVSTFHVIGAHWVAGDAANSFVGFRDIYIDGVKAVTASPSSGNSTLSWSKTTMPSPASLPNSPQVWSIHDYQRLPVILGSGNYNGHNGGNSMPLHVKFVRVWQIPGCGTMSSQ